MTNPFTRLRSAAALLVAGLCLSLTPHAGAEKPADPKADGEAELSKSAQAVIDLGTAYKTSWYLAMRIRKAMGLIELADDQPLTGTLEADETYMGSKKYDKRSQARSVPERASVRHG